MFHSDHKSNALRVAALRAFFCADCLFVLLLISVQPLADAVIQIIADNTCSNGNKKRNSKSEYVHRYYRLSAVKRIGVRQQNNYTIFGKIR